MSTTAYKVLLIDDDSTLLRALDRQLSDFGFEVITSTCASEAAILLRHHRIHAVVCDHNMPGQCGLEFLATVRAKYPDVAVFMLSGQIAGIHVAEQWAREIGVVQVFSKPSPSSQIAAAIELAVRRDIVGQPNNN